MSDVDVIANGSTLNPVRIFGAPSPRQVVGHLGRSVPKAVTPRGADAAGDFVGSWSSAIESEPHSGRGKNRANYR